MRSLLICCVFIGTAYCGTLLHEMPPLVVPLPRDNTNLLSSSNTVETQTSETREKRTSENQIISHPSERVKSLERRFKEQCGNSKSSKCDQILSELVSAHIDTQTDKRRLRNFINMRLCLDNDMKIVQFDTDTQICCNGVFNKTTGKEECCQGDIIDSTEQFCCNEQIQNKTEFSKCCGVFTYDVRTHMCCNGKLFSQSPGLECCGSDVFNSVSEICCFDMYTFSLSQGDACCGTSVYNSSTQTCCDNNIQPAFGRKNRKGDCCKDKSYHADCYKCENNVVTAVFDESSSICCDGRVRNRKYDNETGCCGRKTMNTSTHHCRNREIVEKSLTTLGPLTPSERIGVDFNDTEDNFEAIDVETDDSKRFPSTTVIVIIACGTSVCIGLIVIVSLILNRFCKRKTARKSDDNKHPTRNNISKGERPEGINHNVEETSRYNAENRNTEQLKRTNQDVVHVLNEHHPPVDDEPEENQNLLEDYNISKIARSNVQNKSIGKTKQTNLDISNALNEHQSAVDDGPNENQKLLEGCKISNIAKSNNVPNENMLTNHFKDTFTQTCPDKESNRRTVFGKPFEHNFILGLSNATVQMPNSDVKMTLPQSVLRHNQVEVNCSSFNNISPLRKKLGLTDDEKVASPVVEYALTGHRKLPDYAVVILPFIGSPADLKVKKFKSDEGLNTVAESMDVPVQGKMNEPIDAYYIIKDSFVYVYTKSFSGFYCHTCRHKRPLQLRSFLFGSYKRFTNPLRHEVRMMIYIADEILKFADYKERMFRIENAEGRVLKKEMLLRLPVELIDDDFIQFSLTPTESHCNQWIHKLYPGKTKPIYDKIQKVELHHIADKCKNCDQCHLFEHEVPYSIEWFLTNANGVIPSYTFQCIVDIDVTRNSDGNTTSNRIVIDELQLRQEDRYPIEESFNAMNVQGVKQYLAGGVSQDKLQAVLGSLTSKYLCTGTTVEEVFFKLQEKLTPKYLLEAVAVVLKEKHMFEELDVLQVSGYLPRNLNSAESQAVCEDNEDVLAPNGCQYTEREPVTAIQNARTNAPAVETQESAYFVEERNLHATEQHKPNTTEEKSESPNDISDIPVNNDRLARPELSQPLRTTGFSKSMGDITLKGALPMPEEARGELSTHERDSKSKLESQNLHVQEHASLDETALKNVKC